MTKVCTQAGLSRRDRRFERPTVTSLTNPPRGEGLLGGDIDGLRGGDGNRDCDRGLRSRPPRPISKA
ncbi:hypothetical protein RRF57_008109 [Xylaria bambusicola]|uniref:Uncharacterized protein n=1 Tax=Xylaria bambusicola TaxID=326684 RepID=A0AAN7UUR9_9PEZI